MCPLKQGAPGFAHLRRHIREILGVGLYKQKNLEFPNLRRCTLRFLGGKVVRGKSGRCSMGMRGPSLPREFLMYTGASCLEHLPWAAGELEELCLCSPITKQTDAHCNQVIQSITTFVTATNFGYLWHEKRGRHLFALPLGCRKHFHGGTNTRKGYIYFHPFNSGYS